MSDKTVAIPEIEKDMQRYVGALSEDFQGKVSAIAEQFGGLNRRLDELDERMEERFTKATKPLARIPR